MILYQNINYHLKMLIYLLSYVRESIQAREISKFQFTKVIDLIFESIKLYQKSFLYQIKTYHF